MQKQKAIHKLNGFCSVQIYLLNAFNKILLFSISPWSPPREGIRKVEGELGGGDANLV